MELALESYDVCIGLLQSKPKTPEGKHYTINLPNLHLDAAISVEEVSGLAFYLNLCAIKCKFPCPVSKLTRKPLSVIRRLERKVCLQILASQNMFNM